MPFDPSGNFTRVHSWQDDRDNGIRILADRHDEEDDNFGNAFNLTFLRTGSVPMTGNLQMGGNNIKTIKAGSAAAPSLTWELSNQTGIYQPNSTSLGFASNGVEKFEINNNGVSIFGDTAFNGNLTVAGQATVKALDVRDDTWPIVQISKNVIGFWRLGPVEPSNSFSIAVNGGAPAVVVGTDSSLTVSGALTVVGAGTFNGRTLKVVSPDSSDGNLRLMNTGADWMLGMLGGVGWDRFSIYNNKTGSEKFNIVQNGDATFYRDVVVQGALSCNGTLTSNAGLNIAGVFGVPDGPTTGELAGFYTNAARGGGNGYISIYDTGGRKVYMGYGGSDDTFYINQNVPGDVRIHTNVGLHSAFTPKGFGVGTTTPDAFGRGYGYNIGLASGIPGTSVALNLHSGGGYDSYILLGGGGVFKAGIDTVGGGMRMMSVGAFPMDFLVNGAVRQSITVNGTTVLTPGGNVAPGNATALTMKNTSDGGVSTSWQNGNGELGVLNCNVLSAGAGTDDGMFIFYTATNGALAERLRIQAGNITVNESCSNIVKSVSTGSLNLSGGVDLGSGGVIVLRGAGQAGTPNRIDFYTAGVLRGLFDANGDFTCNQKGYFTSPGTATTGGVVIKDAPGNPQNSWLQFVNNANGVEYGRLGFSGPNMSVSNTFNGSLYLQTNGNTNNLYMNGTSVILPLGYFYPATNNVSFCGASGNAWQGVWAYDHHNASDEREKDWRGKSTLKELKAANRIFDELGFFKWQGRDTWSFGLRAQPVARILMDEGMEHDCNIDFERDKFIPKKERPKLTSPFVQFDTWEADDTKGDGNAFSMNYDQMSLFLIAALDRRLKALEAK